MTDTPRKIKPAPSQSKYGPPSEGVLGDFLSAADKTAAANDAFARRKQEELDKKNALRDKLLIEGLKAEKEMGKVYDAELRPIIEVLLALPAKDGRKFHADVYFTNDDAHIAAEAGDEKKYRGPHLHIALRYDKDWGDGATAHDRNKYLPVVEQGQPMIRIDIGPDRTLDEEFFNITRFDVVTPNYYDQGGMGPKEYQTTNSYSYTDLRRTLGEWLGNVAPDRLADIAAEAKKPPAKSPPPKPKKGGPKLKT